MDITLDQILKSYESNIKDFNYNEINNFYKENYDVLKNYYLIHPQKLDNLDIGDIIRYTKSKDKVSAAGIIIMIKYVNKTIDHFVLRSLPFGKTWRVYPNSYYIFQYDKNNSRQFYQVIKRYINEDDNKDNNKEEKIKDKNDNLFLSIDELIEQNKKYLNEKSMKKINRKLEKILPDIFD